ncbi:MAG TPA: IS66 family transposase [Dongiaceae bacterium]|jgi:transposase|nr:IS66 family transposase [Dongiaceae bacterium]
MDDAAVLDLPDDPILLKQMIVQIKQEAAERLDAMQQRHKAEIDAVLRRFYGPHSERFDPRQLLLFGMRVDSMPIDVEAVEHEAGQPLATRRVGNRHNHGRGLLPGHLERVVVEHDLPEAQKAGKVCIGCEISEQLEFKPGGLFVLQHRRYKYAPADYQQSDTGAQIVIADKPPQPIEKGLAGPGLLAYVITSKLADHLPLYRLEKIFARQDVHVASSTMCAWMAASAQLVAPLYRLMIERVRQSQVIHTDDTRVPVQDEQVKGRCKSGRIWTYIGDRDHPYIVYEYTPDRTRAGPAAWLKEYKGYLQADAYGGYDGIYATGVSEVACWAHARRKFFDARETDSVRAAAMLAMTQDLYKVEDLAKERIGAVAGCTGEQADGIRRELRQEKAVPVLAKIKAWLDEQQKLVLPRSPMAAAMQYTLNQWEALKRYCEAGFLDIDNNAAERAMKRVAIGRKNWLFAGNDAFGQHHAVLWSLIASAEAHGIDPQAYLRSVLAKIAQTPISELEQFLPEVWKGEDACGSQAGHSSILGGRHATAGATRDRHSQRPREVRE